MKTLGNKLMTVIDPQAKRTKLKGKKIKRSLSEDSVQLDLNPKTEKENDKIGEVKQKPLPKVNSSLAEIVSKTDDVI